MGSLELALSKLNLEGLPNPASWIDQVIGLLQSDGHSLMAVYAHYCKISSECASIEAATKLKLGTCSLMHTTQENQLEPTALSPYPFLPLFFPLPHSTASSEVAPVHYVRGAPPSA